MLLFWILIAVSPFIGSFLGVLVLRLPEDRQVVHGRSCCERCGHVLAARDLVPVASFLWLRGRCRYCRQPIGRIALAIELAAVVVPIWAGTVTAGWTLIASCVLGWALLALAMVDWRTMLLPDVLVLPLLALGLLGGFVITRESLPDRVIGAAAGFAALALLAAIYVRLRQREGLGLGDAKLFAAIGAWVGWEGLPLVLLLGSMLGLLYALLRSAAGQRFDLSDRLPFGTFLAAGGWIVWLYKPLMLAFA